MTAPADDLGDRLAVYYTVDTEIWWSCRDLSRLTHDVDRWFHARTPAGDFGVPFQLRLLSEHGLKGVFFIEPFVASVAGPGPLQEMVSHVRDGGGDVQLHAHVEWLALRPHPIVSAASGPHMRSYDAKAQAALLEEGVRNLTEAGALRPTAFRAGNFGADRRTLEALAAVGIGIDSSLDRTYLGGDCRIEGGESMVQPGRLGGVLEVPVTVFRDRPGHLRPMHLNAVSAAEMRTALMRARELGHRTFVIVSHSFELLNDRRERLNPIILRRFESLCRFLADHPEDFATRDFRTPVPGDGDPDAPEIRGRVGDTLLRMAEQLVSRVRHR